MKKKKKGQLCVYIFITLTAIGIPRRRVPSPRLCTKKFSRVELLVQLSSIAVYLLRSEDGSWGNAIKVLAAPIFEYHLH